MAILNVSEQPLEVEFAQTIVGEFLPNLRKLYLAMVAMQIQWQDEDFQAALAEAALSGETLAGFPATTWAAWGSVRCTSGLRRSVAQSRFARHRQAARS